MITSLRFAQSIVFAAVLVAGCSKQEASCPPLQAKPNSAAFVPAAIPPVAPPQAVSLADAKRVFAAHDCCDRYINTDIYRIGALRARGRIFTVFHLIFANPETNHGGELVAILDGLQLLGAYEINDTVMKLRGSRIVFECSPDARDRNPKECDEAAFQDIDLSEPKLPATRVINGQISNLDNSI